MIAMWLRGRAFADIQISEFDVSKTWRKAWRLAIVVIVESYYLTGSTDIPTISTLDVDVILWADLLRRAQKVR